MKKLRVWDPVIVIAGKHKNKVSSIEKMDWDKVWLKDVNVFKKAKKGEWFIKVTLPIHVSNIAYYLSDEKKATKIAIEIDKNWKKSRIAKQTWKAVK